MQAKRIEIVSTRLVKEKSVTYPKRRISSPRDAADILREFFDNQDREQCVAIYLNSKNEPNAIHVVSVGTLNSSIVHPREVFKAAVISNSASLIVAHNHPSSDLEPSKEDIEITKRLSEAGKLLGISLLDHLIISDGNFLSLKERGNL